MQAVRGSWVLETLEVQGMCVVFTRMETETKTKALLSTKTHLELVSTMQKAKGDLSC